MGKRQSSKEDPMGKRQRTERLLKKSILDSLPDDIIYEILVNLPVKTLIRFQCISKSWRALISQPSFQQDYFRRRSQQDPLLLLTRYESEKVSRSTTLHFSTHNSNKGTLIDNFSTTVPQCYFVPLINLYCQGLVCITDSMEEDILICNPSTREITALPRTNRLIQIIGFGYAASSKEFKVVRFCDYDVTDTQYSCEVFTLGTIKWRKAKCPSQYRGPFYRGAPFLHGAVHFLPYIKGPTEDCCLLTFDIQSEKITSGLLPEFYGSIKPYSTYMELTKLGGSLCLSIEFRTIMELWLLKDYHPGKWVKECTIDITSFGYYASGVILLSMGDGSILMTICDEKLYSYNPRDRTFTEKGKGSYSAALYVESFLSPEVLFSHSEPRDLIC